MRSPKLPHLQFVSLCSKMKAKPVRGQGGRRKGITAGEKTNWQQQTPNLYCTQERPKILNTTKEEIKCAQIHRLASRVGQRSVINTYSIFKIYSTAFISRRNPNIRHSSSDVYMLQLLSRKLKPILFRSQNFSFDYCKNYYNLGITYCIIRFFETSNFIYLTQSSK